MKIILVILLISPWLWAQNSLEELIEESLTQNPLLKAEKNKYLAKEFMAEREGVLPDPVLGFTQWIEPVETRVGAQQNIFSLSQKIPFPGKRGLKEDIGLAAAQSDRYYYSALKLNIIYNVKTSYFDLYLSDRSLLILLDYFAQLKDFVEISTVKYSTGQGVQAHVLKAQVEVSTIQSRIFDMQRNRNSAQTKLNNLRNVDPNQQIIVIDDLDSSYVNLAEINALLKSYQKHPQYLAAQSSSRQSALQKDLAFKEWFPDFTFQANYITVDGNNPAMTDNGKDAWGLMVGVNLPLWFAGRKAQVQESEYNILMRQDYAENIKSQLQMNISDLVFKANSFKETISLFHDVLIPQAEISLQSALSAYRSGTFGFLDLLDSERMLLQLRLAFLKEQVNYRKTIADLERSVAEEL